MWVSHETRFFLKSGISLLKLSATTYYINSKHIYLPESINFCDARVLGNNPLTIKLVSDVFIGNFSNFINFPETEVTITTVYNEPYIVPYYVRNVKNLVSSAYYANSYVELCYEGYLLMLPMSILVYADV